jgi:hypothetical protein
MSISIQPTNQNLAQSTKFQLVFDRLPYMTFFCTSVNIPGLSIDALPQTTTFIDLHVPGNKLSYDDLEIKFLVDEDYRSWLSVHDWIRGMSFPENFEEYRNLKFQRRSMPLSPVADKPQYSDASLTIYTNRNNPNLSIKFIDCFPTSLSSIKFDVENNADNIIVGNASFNFSYYMVERV